jgi:DNA-binding beta-propeller fold protein YncE
MDMGKRIGVFLAVLVIIGFSGNGICSVELNVQQTLKLEGTPVDVAVSPSGQSIYVLTDRGEILIYSADGSLRDRVEVSKTLSAISVGPRDDVLFLTDRAKGTIEVVTLDLVQNINVTGAPFKGPENAPVVIVVFSDFQ